MDNGKWKITASFERTEARCESENVRTGDFPDRAVRSVIVVLCTNSKLDYQYPAQTRYFENVGGKESVYSGENVTIQAEFSNDIANMIPE